MRLICLIFAVCILSACSHRTATPDEDVWVNAPPTIEKTEKASKSYPKQHQARVNDMLIQNCTVTIETGNKATCICRNATTHLDANDPSKQMMVCK